MKSLEEKIKENEKEMLRLQQDYLNLLKTNEEVENEKNEEMQEMEENEEKVIYLFNLVISRKSCRKVPFASKGGGQTCFLNFRNNIS